MRERGICGRIVRRRFIAVAAGFAVVVLLAAPVRPAAGTPVVTITSYGDPTISVPLEIAAGPDGALWFANLGNNTIGRITTAGAVNNFGSSSIRTPLGITLGPDGALWFANQGTNTIGRITTGGVVSTYSDSTIRTPVGITAGPDGALWFTNYGGNTIGRSRPVARSRITPTPAFAHRTESRSGPTALFGSRTPATTRSDASR
jgi:virginiamycin B lyase